MSVYDARDEENFSRDQSLPSQSGSIAVPVVFPVPSDALVQAGDAQSWNGRAMSASWRRIWSPAVTTTATVSRSRFEKTHDQGFFLTSPASGADYAVPAGREDSDGFSERNESGRHDRAGRRGDTRRLQARPRRRRRSGRARLRLCGPHRSVAADQRRSAGGAGARAAPAADDDREDRHALRAGHVASGRTPRRRAGRSPDSLRPGRNQLRRSARVRQLSVGASGAGQRRMVDRPSDRERHHARRPRARRRRLLGPGRRIGRPGSADAAGQPAASPPTHRA